MLPSRVVTIHDVDGVSCVSTSAPHQRWRQNFTKVLNIMSEFDQSELDFVRQREVDDTLASVSIATDVRKALSKLKNVKAAGSSAILPEMLKYVCSDVVGLVKHLINEVWLER